MAGRRAGGARGRLEDYVRRAYTADPVPAVRHPRRLAVAPRAAVGAGLLLLLAAVVLAGHSVLTATRGGGGPGAAAVTAGQTAPATTPATTGTPGTPGTSAPGSGGAGAAVVTDPLTGTTTQGRVTVHVTGAVTTPGVVTLPAGSRVADAVAAVGGASTDADTEALNLARPLADGEQVRVPHVGEEAGPGGTGPGAGADAGPGAASGAASGGGGAAGGRVPLNTADAAALETLPGIGPSLAQRIIDHRESNGPFTSVEDLTDVPGIGQATLARIRDKVTL